MVGEEGVGSGGKIERALMKQLNIWFVFYTWNHFRRWVFSSLILETQLLTSYSSSCSLTMGWGNSLPFFAYPRLHFFVLYMWAQFSTVIVNLCNHVIYAVSTPGYLPLLYGIGTRLPSTLTVRTILVDAVFLRQNVIWHHCENVCSTRSTPIAASIFPLIFCSSRTVVLADFCSITHRPLRPLMWNTFSSGIRSNIREYLKKKTKYIERRVVRDSRFKIRNYWYNVHLCIYIWMRWFNRRESSVKVLKSAHDRSH